ncbi:MAG: hypothetical protein ABSF46_26030 [Terriglobia bacterium]|jgi:hypothetical protein
MAPYISRSTLNWTIVLVFLLVAVAVPRLDAPRQISATALARPLQARAPSGGASSAGSVQDLQTIPDSREIPLSDKQKREMLKANFDRMKRDAKELADLAKDLQEQLDKSNENVLSLGIVDKADKIEKLARKIKSTARGY